MTTPAPKIKAAAIPTTIPFGADVVGWCSSCNSVCDTGTIDTEDRYCCGACGDHLIFAAEVLIERLARAESEVRELKQANELDRRSLFAVVRAIDEEITGRMWLIEGRGCYEWNDEKYRKEFGWAINALQAKLEPLRKIAADLTHCCETEKELNSVRKLESENESLKAALTEWEDREAAICPEDVSFEEVITSLKEITEQSNNRHERALSYAREVDELRVALKEAQAKVPQYICSQGHPCYGNVECVYCEVNRLKAALARMGQAVTIREWGDAGRTAPPRDNGFDRCNRIIASRVEGSGKEEG